MSSKVLGHSCEADNGFELTGLRNMPKGELREFIAELLIEIENLANIAELPRVENLLRFAISDLRAQQAFQAVSRAPLNSGLYKSRLRVSPSFNLHS
jgi:hypothetical protein